MPEALCPSLALGPLLVDSRTNLETAIARLILIGCKWFGLGENALVPLAGFTVDTTESKKMRQFPRTRYST